MEITRSKFISRCLRPVLKWVSSLMISQQVSLPLPQFVLFAFSLCSESGIGFVKPTSTGTARASVLLPSQSIREGWLRLHSDVRWFRLTLHKLEFWRTQGESGSQLALGEISLGFKELVPHGHLSFQIKQPVSSHAVTLHCKEASEFTMWLKQLIFVISDFRTSFLQSQSLFFHNDWIHTQLSVFVGTWNVGNAPPQDNLTSWLPVQGQYDIIAIGAQECKYTPPRDAGTSSNTEDWFARIVRHVGPRYVVVFRESLWEIRNIVLVRKSLTGFVHSVQGATVATGIANTLGNKGGVGIRLCIYDSSFCFINSHLAAHQEGVSARNYDYSQIITHMRLGRSDVEVTNGNHYCFWYGDLNYRLEDTRPNVLARIHRGHRHALHDIDQLRKVMAEKHAFVGFTETLPPFRPTYRYDRFVVDIETGERVYSEEKQRVPSWCDRILYKAFPGAKIEQHEYHCQDKVQSSDHSPVYAAYTVAARLPVNILPALNGRPFSRSRVKTKHSIMQLLSGSGIPKGAARISFTDLSVASWCGREPNIYLKFISPLLPSERKWKTPINRKVLNSSSSPFYCSRSLLLSSRFSSLFPSHCLTLIRLRLHHGK